MISYAPEEGGIGPHVDNYDVFLLQVIRPFIFTRPHTVPPHPHSTPPHPSQGRGSRRWRIQGVLLGAKEEREGLIPNSPVRILADFEEDHAWVLQPGDMLYLPPRCVSVSVSLPVSLCLYLYPTNPTHSPTYSLFLKFTHLSISPSRSVPHDGVSLDGDCMTYSIGFRAPAQKELVAATAAAAQALLDGEG